ncbi:MAG: class I SAM-dependent methyltransferase [Patescibacteria group bacterium UBA2163]
MSQEKPPISHNAVPLEHYDAEYARKYIERTLGATYTRYKNRLIAEKCAEDGATHVVDIGGNVSGIIRAEGSLRTQLEKHDINYIGVDLIPDYFDPKTAHDLGVPPEGIYEEVEGYVADIENLPFEDESVEAVVCADVIEHVPDPQKAFTEVARVLSKDGTAFFVIPSMYKIDLFDFAYVEEKRTSSHVSKLIIDDWEVLWEEAGLELDPEASQPVGIASGLSYLSWIDEEVIPDRPDLDGKEEYSEKSIAHRRAKEILGLYDEAIDAYIFEHGIEALLVEALQEGDMQRAFRILKEAILAVVAVSEEEAIVLDTFFNMVEGTAYTEERVTHIMDTFTRAKEPRLLLGNSVLVSLRHKEQVESEEEDALHENEEGAEYIEEAAA